MVTCETTRQWWRKFGPEDVRNSPCSNSLSFVVLVATGMAGMQRLHEKTVAANKDRPPRLEEWERKFLCTRCGNERRQSEPRQLEPI